MTRLSVNINKIATIRNARGGNIPDLIKTTILIQEYGTDGITVHPRPDERHIKYSDVYELNEVVNVEFNIEGYPHKKFIELIENIKPDQVTLVPDAPDVITSNAGWNTIENSDMLTEIIAHLKNLEIRTSLFIDPDLKMIEKAKEINTDRIELYTEKYATKFEVEPEEAIADYKRAANYAHELGLEVNAGHDLNLENLHFFVLQIPFIKEVSIGHALISDALYFGLENTVNLYKRALLIHETQS